MRPRNIPTLATVACLDSTPGELSELPGAGSSLENPCVYDASVRELEELGRRGLLEIVERKREMLAGQSLIRFIRFKRLR